MSSFLDRLRDRMSGSLNKPLFARPKPKDKVRHTIATNRWDQRVWETARSTEAVDSFISDLSNGDIHRGGSRPAFEAAPELAHDLFMAFYKAVPQLEKKRDIDKECYPVHKIISEMVDNPRLKDLQDITASDPAMSTIALSAVGDTVREIIGRIPPPPPPPPQPGGTPGGKGKDPGEEPLEGEPTDEEGGHPGKPGKGDQKGENKPQEPQKPGKEDEEGDDAGEAEEPQEDDEDDGEGDDGEGDPEIDNIDPDGDDFDPDSEDETDKAEADWQDAYDKLLDDLDLDRAMNKALEAAEKEASDLDNLRRGIGLDDGQWQQMSPEKRLKMAQRLNTPEMRLLAEAIGRMKRFALGVKATRVVDVPHEAFDVETGNDLKRLLRSEFGLLSTPETTYEFYRKYADKELLQFKMRGKEEVGKGPIVIAIDKSGSMNGAPFNWAMGVAEALRRFAGLEKRDYYAMFFGSNNDRNRFDFPGGESEFEKVMTFLSVQANGGTEFDGVLTEALQKASQSFDGEAKGKADIVFVTDGQAHLSPEWIKGFNAERERVGVRVYSVYIGGARDMRYNGGPLALLEQISDVTIPVSELRPESAKAIFERV